MRVPEGMKEQDWTRVLGWPGYRVYRTEIDEPGKKLKLWVRRKKAGMKLICSGCGQHVPASRIQEICEREVRDLPCFEYSTTIVVETYRMKCPRCGFRAEKVAQLPSKAPFSKRFEEAVSQACESAAARQVARRLGMAESTVRAIDLRCLERWESKRRKPPLIQMGVDELYRGKADKFLTVVCNLETGEPLWFGEARKKETLDEFFRSQLRSQHRKRIEATCLDMWAPFRLSIEQWAPQCKIVYDKFHILQHANEAIDEVRKAEFFRQGKKKRGLIKGKKWLLMSRWRNLTKVQRGELNRSFQLNRRVFKAYVLKESLEKLWDYRYEGAMFKYLMNWMGQLKWQRLTPFEDLADMLERHLDGILNYCRTKVRSGVVEALNGNIRMLINRGRGYKNTRYLLLKAKRMAVTNAQFVELQQVRKAG
jgi:transposase